jgi:hypothetical protein
LTDSFTVPANLKLVVLALLGSTAGQGVVWYCGQFYALFFLTVTLKMDILTAYVLVGLGLLIGTPFFIVFGKLSDRIGRKPIILGGCLLAVLTYHWIFGALTHYANPTLEDAQKATPVTLYSAEATGAVGTTFEAMGAAFKQIVGGKPAPSPTNEARAYLNSKGIPFTISPAKPNEALVMQIGDKTVTGFALPADKAANAASKKAYDDAIAGTGYTKMTIKNANGTVGADETRMNKPMLVVLLSILMIYVTMVYGPIAAQLVELFPTRIRYSSMSLPYHIGNGWFGGFLPLIATSIVVFTGNIYNGLWYPIAVATMTFFVGLFFLPETKDVDISK